MVYSKHGIYSLWIDTSYLSSNFWEASHSSNFLSQDLISDTTALIFSGFVCVMPENNKCKCNILTISDSFCKSSSKGTPHWSYGLRWEIAEALHTIVTSLYTKRNSYEHDHQQCNHVVADQLFTVWFL